jgi:hypothetical protein
MNKEEKFKQALLGDELYSKCIQKYGVSRSELKNRFEEIKTDPSILDPIAETALKFYNSKVFSLLVDELNYKPNKDIKEDITYIKKNIDIMYDKLAK